MRLARAVNWVAAWLVASACASAKAEGGMAITCTFPAAAPDGVLDGRLLLIVSTDDTDEPRMQIDPTPDSQLVFGVDVENLRGRTLRVPARAFIGYPIRSLAHVPAGDYNVQAVLHLYETVHRSDGHTIKVPIDRGEGQKWNRAPGNLFSRPARMRVRAGTSLRVVLDQVVGPIEPPKDTNYVRHVTVRSQLLSTFWGRPMDLTAHVLVPEGFEEHPNARYPLVVAHDHHRGDFPGFRTEPADPNLRPDYSKRFHLAGYNRIEQQEAYAFYQRWTSKDFPRFLIVYLDHANPYTSRVGVTDARARVGR